MDALDRRKISPLPGIEKQLLGSTARSLPSMLSRLIPRTVHILVRKPQAEPDSEPL
jgi:hypothetical protein